MATRGDKYWQHSFELNGGRQAEDTGHECARDPGEWCSGSRIIEGDNGQMRRAPGLTPRAFCDPCEIRIFTCLSELVSAYGRLAEHLIDPTRGGGQVIRVPFGPRIPLSADADALMRRMGDVLGSWHERVAMVARLTAPDTEASRTHPAETVDAAVPVLSEHLSVLLALAPEPMTRVMSPREAEEWADDPGAFTVVRSGGEAWVTRPMAGADAGNEVLDLHYRARRILGETKAPAEAFDGVPCRECESLALERAEPPSDPELPAMKSRCATCSDEMTAEEFKDWASRYKKWAESAAIPACRRCQRGNHEQCQWQGCGCRGSGHAVAA